MKISQNRTQELCKICYIQIQTEQSMCTDFIKKYEISLDDNNSHVVHCSKFSSYEKRP